MADIDVVKKGSRTWLWIVIALAVVLILWWVMSRPANGTRTTQSVPRATQPAHTAATLVPAGAPATTRSGSLFV